MSDEKTENSIVVTVGNEQDAAKVRPQLETGGWKVANYLDFIYTFVVVIPDDADVDEAVKRAKAIPGVLMATVNGRVRNVDGSPSGHGKTRPPRR